MPVITLEDLTARQVFDVLELRNAVAAATGSSPLSDQVVGAIKGLTEGLHLLQTSGDRVVGYAHVEAGSDPVAELVAGDDGDVSELLGAINQATGGTVRIWTRGDRAPLNDVLPGLGFTVRRTLWQMRRPLKELEVAEPTWPDGVSLRQFRAGVDEAAWLAVNNAAFAGHPEQAGWTLEDISSREEEPWFDPAGFFLAVADERVIGFHWTKVHPAHGASDALGEVYVIGVDPSMQGKGLGEALLLRGLQHLRDHSLPTVLLYVEADNRSAIALYERHGFSRWDADRLFARTQ